ncbi:MAG TPA: metalloregulator ArsR/SmtB family transcription factor [Gaiellaceae bacterium]|nr:metalloregulator ArsR/SmtB family transcription factor [Gaiellaceae bacterium]
MSFAQAREDPDSRAVRIGTAAQLQALAHPVRLRLLEALGRRAATATQLARELGESSGSTSYHLRVLGRAGIIEEDSSRRHGRERWWRRPEESLLLPSGSDEPDERAAELRLRSYFVERDDDALRTFIDGEDVLPAEWRASAFIGNWTVWLTPEEANELGARIVAMLEPYRSREERPENARKLLATYRALPGPDES